MKGQGLLKQNASGTTSLQGRHPARTVLVEMAKDQARAERIRDVVKQRKASDPTFTTAWIAEQLGVDPRSIGYWKSVGAISRDNSDKLADLAGVDRVWLWLGRKEADPPDLLDVLNGDGPSGQVEDVRAEFREHVKTMNSKLDEILEKLAAAELANALEAISDPEEPDVDKPEEPSRDEEDPDSEETG